MFIRQRGTPVPKPEMPLRFMNTFVACLKKTMLPRVPLCKYTQDDIKFIETETGLEVSQIEDWAKNFRFRMRPAEREAALQEEDVKVRKYIHHCT